MWQIRKDRDGVLRFDAPFDEVRLCLQADPDNPGSCGSAWATYRRTSASPPGPVYVIPRWGFPATSVGQSVSSGPNGEKLSQYSVQYSVPSPTLSLSDTFECVANCP
ncbi:MAG TPA: hypothetical protein VFS50_02425 [Meiothermus sp.]|nr:hypothetical protein [Meiothermus sp.]